MNIKDYKPSFRFLGKERIIICTLEKSKCANFGVGVSYCADEDISFYSERFGMRLAHTRAEYDLYKRVGEKQKAAEKAKEVYKMIKDFDKAIGSIKSQRRRKN